MTVGNEEIMTDRWRVVCVTEYACYDAYYAQYCKKRIFIPISVIHGAMNTHIWRHV